MTVRLCGGCVAAEVMKDGGDDWRALLAGVDPCRNDAGIVWQDSTRIISLAYRRPATYGLPTCYSRGLLYRLGRIGESILLLLMCLLRRPW